MFKSISDENEEVFKRARMMMDYIKRTIGQDISPSELLNNNIINKQVDLLQRQLAKQRVKMLLKNRMMKYRNIGRDNHL